MSDVRRQADGAWYGPPLNRPGPPAAIWTTFESHAARSPATVWGFRTGDVLTRRSSAELHREARQLAGALQRLGLRPGDAIVAQLPNCREGAVAFFAAMALGLLYVPVVHIYGPAELGFIVANSRARALIVPSRWRNIDYVDRLRRLPGLEKLEKIITLGDAGLALPNVSTWDELLATAADCGPLPRVAADAPCLIVYTSGTTAMPKGAVHSHDSLLGEVCQNDAFLRDLGNRTQFVGAPAGHIGPITMMLRQTVYGMDSVYLDYWEAGVAADLIEEFRAGWSTGVPYHVLTLLPFAAAGRMPTLELFSTGGTSVPPALIEQAEQAGMTVCRSYGSTEQPTISNGLKTDSLQRRSRSDGRLLPGSVVRILDENDRDVADGEAGEIVSRGPERFVGYFDPELNRDAFTADGWFRTGDIGSIDAQGFLSVVDRKKDILIRGGENISAKEVEDILARHAAVVEAAVIGWPDAVYGERVGAFVTLRENARLELDEVRRHFEAQGVAKQKMPERLVVVGEFPRNPSGKILKIELRKRAREII